jgi:hypothetical protein
MPSWTANGPSVAGRNCLYSSCCETMLTVDSMAHLLPGAYRFVITVVFTDEGVFHHQRHSRSGFSLTEGQKECWLLGFDYETLTATMITEYTK